MDKKLLTAYGDYLDSPNRRAAPCEAMAIAVSEGKTVEEYIIDALREADMLPVEYRDNHVKRNST